jgi:hypothetical protein
MSARKPARRCVREFLLSAALIVATRAPALAQDACAKYEDAFAYNQCLATQGPKAHETRAVDVPAGERATTSDARRGRIHTSLQVVHRRNGRMVAEFTITPSGGRPSKLKRPLEEDAPSQ